MVDPAFTGDVFEFSLTLRRADPVKEELIRTLLLREGFSPLEWTEKTFSDGKWTLALYLPVKELAAKIRRRLSEFSLRGVAVKFVRVRPSEWLEKWKSSIRPFNLTPRVRVVPSWCREKKNAGCKEVIRLDTTMAFGTGLHETTRMMAELIESCRGQFDDFLDVGTGTGILAILAAKCGARKIVGIDFDEECIRTARQNVTANQCRLIELRHADIRTFGRRERFDLIAANLYSEDLIALRESLAARLRPGKFLAISGIALNHWPKCRRAFQDTPLKCRKVLKGRTWAAALYQRNGS